MSVADAELFDEHVKHLHAKLGLEKYLRGSGVPFSILRPCAFFENLDDAANWNPLKKGVVKFLSLQDCKYCATYDIGRAAAIQLKNPQQWLGKTLDVIGWQGGPISSSFRATRQRKPASTLRVTKRRSLCETAWRSSRSSSSKGLHRLHLHRVNAYTDHL